MDSKIKELQDAIIKGIEKDSGDIAKKLIADGNDPLFLLNDVMIPGLSLVGEKFEKGEFFLPELMATGQAGMAVADVIESAMLSSGNDMPIKGVFVMGTVKDDVHSIGKNLVSMMMKVNGFKVIDIGVDVQPAEFLEAAKDADVIGLSALLTLALQNMETTIKLIAEKYPNVKIIIGGAATDPILADKFGVLYGADAAMCPVVIEKAMKGV